MEVSPEAAKAFSPEQLAKYARAFEMFDINKDGVLESRELVAVSKVLGYRLPKEAVSKMMEIISVKDSGTLTFDEFLSVMPGYERAIPEEEQRKVLIRRQFQEYDKNGDGFISPEEAHQVLSKELGFSEKQTQGLVKEFDKNSDGKLSYEEFVEFYTKVEERKEEIRGVFKQFDLEDKGYVSMEDAQRVLGDLEFTDSEIIALVNTYDTNNDGKLQFEEFVHFWRM